MKVVLVGPSGSYKSTLLHTYINQTEMKVESPTSGGADFATKEIQFGSSADESERVEFWDTSIGETATLMYPMHMMGSDCVIIALHSPWAGDQEQLTRYLKATVAQAQQVDKLIPIYILVSFQENHYQFDLASALSSCKFLQPWQKQKKVVVVANVADVAEVNKAFHSILRGAYPIFRQKQDRAATRREQAVIAVASGVTRGLLSPQVRRGKHRAGLFRQPATSGKRTCAAMTVGALIGGGVGVGLYFLMRNCQFNQRDSITGGSVLFLVLFACLSVGFRQAFATSSCCNPRL